MNQVNRSRSFPSAGSSSEDVPKCQRPPAGTTTTFSNVARSGTGRSWWMALIVLGIVGGTWTAVSISGLVELKYAGDESARLLMSYEITESTALREFVSSSETWLTIHPPGDFIFKAAINKMAALLVDGPRGFIALHKGASALLVVTGLALIALGLVKGRSRLGSFLFIGLAVLSLPVLYVAHHALAEAPALFLVGLSVFLTLQRPISSPRAAAVAALPLVLAGLFRPEAALVFAALGVIPLLAGHWWSALLFVAVSAGPILGLTVATEFLTSEVTYASVRPFPGQPIHSVLANELLSRSIWGLGINPWLGLGLLGGLGVGTRFVTKRGARRLVGLAVSAAWLFWGLGFVVLISLGVIPQQDRVFVFPAVLGMLAVALVASDLFEDLPGGRSSMVEKLIMASTAALAVLSLINLPGQYDAWEAQVPPEAVQVNEVLATRSQPDGAVLLDWMWWWEWPASVYASRPGLPSGICNYSVCTPSAGSERPPLIATDGLTAIESERLSHAWTFVSITSPEYIVMQTEAEYREWLAYQRSLPEQLSSFVRPLLEARGDCYITAAGLEHARYCPVMTNSRYVVLERQTDG